MSVLRSHCLLLYTIKKQKFILKYYVYVSLFLRSYWAEACLSKEESTYVFHTAVTSTTPAGYGWLSESAKAETAKVAMNAGESGKIMTFEEIFECMEDDPHLGFKS